MFAYRVVLRIQEEDTIAHLYVVEVYHVQAVSIHDALTLGYEKFISEGGNEDLHILGVDIKEIGTVEQATGTV